MPITTQEYLALGDAIAALKDAAIYVASCGSATLYCRF